MSKSERLKHLTWKPGEHDRDVVFIFLAVLQATQYLKDLRQSPAFTFAERDLRAQFDIPESL